jgi:hypothetical protein
MFDSDPAGRKQAGTGHRIYRSVENSSDVFVAVEFASIDDDRTPFIGPPAVRVGGCDWCEG